ncbi:MAG: M48 family metallopeptidase [Planctomycetota bacterium]
MDFFESQELARKKTKWLVFLFVIAVIAIIVSIYLIVSFTVVFIDVESSGGGFNLAFNWRLVLGITCVVLMLMAMGSLFKMFELQQGGAAVASMLGGRRIMGNAKELTDRKVANIVEEMALASGTPVPPVYIIDNEESINAFAAGYTVDDAVIGINRGTAEKLSREELQGVVAHEFSHILNGDMRLSLRMVSILHGLLLLSIVGGQIMRIFSHTAGHTMYRRSSRDNEGAIGGIFAATLIIGGGLYLLGSIGLFFGRWIKSTISQQREYLADASAVQFTRIPSGIAGALKMIGASAEQSHMKSANAEQISHMFFGTARSSFFFATHPPLLNRICAIEEDFDGNFLKYVEERKRRYQDIHLKQNPKKLDKKERLKKMMNIFKGTEDFDITNKSGKSKFPINPLLLIAGIGIPTEEDVEFSGFLVEEIPAVLLESIRDTFAARCVVFASLLSQESEVLENQVRLIQSNEDKGTIELTLKMKAMLDELPKHLRLGVFEIIQGTLSAMSPGQYPTFRTTVNELIVADRIVDLFEFFLFHHLIVHLDRCFYQAAPPRNKFHRISDLIPEVAQLVSILAQVGQTSEAEQKQAFGAGMKTILPQTDIEPLFVPKWDHRALTLALTKMSQAIPPVKKQILSAAVVTISADKFLTVEEVELFRAMSESLDCPVPPLVATRDKVVELPDVDDIVEATIVE